MNTNQRMPTLYVTRGSDNSFKPMLVTTQLKRPCNVHDIDVWAERGNQGLKILDDYLESHEFVTEHGYSVADIAVYGYAHLANEGGFELESYKHVSALD